MRRLLLVVLLSGAIFANEIDTYIQTLETEAKQKNSNFDGFSVKRGEAIFFSSHIGKRGKKVSCASCHTNNLTQNGENLFTGKKISPLSPKVNLKRFTKVKKVKKWIRRNFKDVYKREGTAQEKGDVLKFMMK